jgi:hypothetical protein
VPGDACEMVEWTGTRTILRWHGSNCAMFLTLPHTTPLLHLSERADYISRHKHQYRPRRIVSSKWSRTKTTIETITRSQASPYNSGRRSVLHTAHTPLPLVLPALRVRRPLRFVTPRLQARLATRSASHDPRQGLDKRAALYRVPYPSGPFG